MSGRRPIIKKYAKEFTISTAEQRSERWYAERAGIPSASGLGFLFDVLKDGRTPSAKAKKYLKQIAFERKFKVTWDIYDSKPMQDGRYYEDFAKMIYERETGNKVTPATSYVSSWFVATPDGYVTGESKGKGLIECKIVRDESFMDFIEGDIAIEHELQTQGQLLASGLDWVDYIIVNLKTQAYYIRRVHRNNTLIKRIYERLHEPLDLPKIDFGDVKYFDKSLMQEFIDDRNSIIVDGDIKLNLPF